MYKLIDSLFFKIYLNKENHDLILSTIKAESSKIYVQNNKA